MKYKNIIFDLGRVLLEWNPEYVVKDVFKDRDDLPIALASIPKTDAWHRFDRGTLSWDGLTQEVVALFGEDAALFVEKHADYLVPSQKGLEIFYAIKSRGYNIYILSNMSQPVFTKVSEGRDFFNDVDGIIISGEIKSIKPELEIYQTLLDRFNLKPEECLFIDDKQDNIDAGRALGIDGIVCDDYDRVIEELKALDILD